MTGLLLRKLEYATIAWVYMRKYSGFLIIVILFLNSLTATQDFGNPSGDYGKHLFLHSFLTQGKPLARWLSSKVVKIGMQWLRCRNLPLGQRVHVSHELQSKLLIPP